VADVPDGRRRPHARTEPPLPQYAPEKLPYAIDRYTNEAKRLYGVIDRRLAVSKWLGGNEYSIADIATWPWLRNWKNQGIELSEYPHLKAWYQAIAERPAVQRGVKVLADLRKPITDDKSREILFGKTQYEQSWTCASIPAPVPAFPQNPCSAAVCARSC
jgi:hypothetical protein